jgi:hypothetical protein
LQLYILMTQVKTVAIIYLDDTSKDSCNYIS